MLPLASTCLFFATASNSDIFKVCCSTRSGSQTASFRSTTCWLHFSWAWWHVFLRQCFLYSCFYPHQLIGVGWGGGMLTLVWSCIGCARYGGHRVGAKFLAVGVRKIFACHFATWSMWRCRSVRWSKWKANESSLEHNCSIRGGAIWKSMCPKSWALMKDWGTRDAARLEQYVRSFSVSLESENECGKCICQKTCKASRISVRKYDPAEKREAWIAIALQIARDAHAPMQKNGGKMHVCKFHQISNMKENMQNVGTLETSMYECGDERPRGRYQRRYLVFSFYPIFFQNPSVRKTRIMQNSLSPKNQNWTYERAYGTSDCAMCAVNVRNVRDPRCEMWSNARGQDTQCAQPMHAIDLPIAQQNMFIF